MKNARELAVQAGDNLADSFGSSSGARNDVAVDRASTTPILVGRTIDSLLGGGRGVHRGHETLNDSVLVVDDLGKRSEAVGCARSVGDLWQGKERDQ